MYHLCHCSWEKKILLVTSASLRNFTFCVRFKTQPLMFELIYRSNTCSVHSSKNIVFSSFFKLYLFSTGLVFKYFILLKIVLELYALRGRGLLLKAFFNRLIIMPFMFCHFMLYPAFLSFYYFRYAS